MDRWGRYINFCWKSLYSKWRKIVIFAFLIRLATFNLHEILCVGASRWDLQKSVSFFFCETLSSKVISQKPKTHFFNILKFIFHPFPMIVPFERACQDWPVYISWPILFLIFYGTIWLFWITNLQKSPRWSQFLHALFTNSARIFHFRLLERANKTPLLNSELCVFSLFIY